MEDANARFLFAATACHSGIFLGSLYLSDEFDRWSAESQRGPSLHGEVQVGRLDRLGRREHDVLVHVHKLQSKHGGACGRVQQDGLTEWIMIDAIL